MSKESWIGVTWRDVVIGTIIAAVLTVVLLISMSMASAKDNTPRGEPRTTTTIPSWPKPQIHTIAKNKDGVGYTPNDISYWWHGTIDGRECILVEDKANPALSCDWGHGGK